MKISELPQEVKIKALEYQKNNSALFNKNTDCLHLAFDWESTEEGDYYWLEWFELSAPEIKMYSEEDVLSLFNKYKEDFGIYRNMQIMNVAFDEWFNKFKK